jgi:predicted MFS family arabinose efflux permease
MNDGFMGTLPLLLPFISKDIPLSLSQIGFLGAMLTVLNIVLAIPASFIGKQLGHFRVLILAVLLYALGYLFVSQSFSFQLLLFCFGIAGVGFGSFHTIAFSIVALLSTNQNRGKHMGDFTAWGDLGRLGLTSLMTVLVVMLGWRIVTLSYGVVALLVFIGALLILQKMPHHVRQANQDQEPLSFKELLRQKKYLLSVCTATFDSFASSSLYIFIPFLWIAKGFSIELLGIFSATFFFGNFLGKAVLGRLVDRFENIRIFILAELCMALSIILLASSTTMVVFILTSIALGVFTKGTAPIIQTLIAQAVTHESHYEKAFGFKEVNTGIASSLAPILLGVLSDQFGIMTAFYGSALFAIIAILPALLLRRINAMGVK